MNGNVDPGEHDEYYAFLSGGHSGDVRVYGVPSMRQIMRIPVFQPESARGYGHDDETRRMLEEAGGYTWGDTHHPRVSQTDNDYDGRWLFINDKANGRMARIDLKYFETDAIVDIPNQQGTHGACARLPDTDLIFGVGEFPVPMPNDGRDVDDPRPYRVERRCADITKARVHLGYEPRMLLPEGIRLVAESIADPERLQPSRRTPDRR